MCLKVAECLATTSTTDARQSGRQFFLLTLRLGAASNKSQMESAEASSNALSSRRTECKPTTLQDVRRAALWIRAHDFGLTRAVEFSQLDYPPSGHDKAFRFSV